MSSELTRRVAVAVVGIPAVLVCLALGGWVLGGLMALAGALGVRELYAMARSGTGHPFEAAGILAASGLVLLAVRWPQPAALAPVAAGLLVVLTLLLLGAAVWLRGPDGHPLRAVGTTVLGVLYVGGTLAFVPILRALPVAPDPSRSALSALLAPSAFVLLPLLVTWVGDSAAYFVGRGLGRHKLAPRASPSKTVEGALAGLAGSALAGALVVAWAIPTGDTALPPALTGAWIGLLVGAAGQVGDLAESVLKREAGVKDSSHLLPGHGGVLDRLDALLFAFPVTWALLTLAGLGL